MFPTENIPSNVFFIQANLLDGLQFPENFFDFIHQRCLFGAFTQEQWERITVPELSRVLKPTGWIEFVETDIEFVSKGPATRSISDAGKSKKI